jgi:hypothetical protein
MEPQRLGCELSAQFDLELNVREVNAFAAARTELTAARSRPGRYDIA